MTIFTDFDWSTTPLGPRETWSAALSTIYDLMLSAHVAMCAAWGPEQTFLYNAAYAPFLGARHPAALGQPIPEVWPELWPDIGPLIAQAMAGERVQFTGRHLVMTRNGQPEDTYWDFSYSALREGNKVVGFLNVTTEATQHVVDRQKRDAAAAVLRSQNSDLEQQITESAAELKLFRDVIQASSSPICVFDRSQRLIAFNKAQGHEFHRVYGVDIHLGDVFPDRFPLRDQGEVVRRFIERALAGEAFTAIGSFGDPSRSRADWEITYTPLRDDRGLVIGAFYFATDVSERVRAENDLAAAQQALRQSQKMEAVGQLTGGLAHDFNNLLAGISGSLELLGTRILQGRLAEVDKYVVAAQGATRRAAALTHRLLAFSRRQTLAPKTTDVNALAQGMLELIQRTVGPNVEVEFIGMSGLWIALVDAPQLESALLNLCINARDAMPEGGRITIETGNRYFDRDTAQRQDVLEGQYLSLCVTDTGTGMPPDVTAKAFDPFFTTKPIGQGTGLGLSMIYGFARQSGGQVRIHSTVGAGTTVCIYLPRHRGAVETEEASSVSATSPLAGAGETVLVVDDEPTVRMLVADVLEDLGYTAIEASDGASGLHVLQSDARVDLLITDVGLPGGMNGRQVADAARVCRPDLKVLFITGYAENALLNDGQLEPGMSVLTKPFAVDAMAARIRELMATQM